jgi:hypothetical protein
VVCHDFVSPLVGGAGAHPQWKNSRELADRGRFVTIVAPSHSDMVRRHPWHFDPDTFEVSVCAAA